jgi:hypothetical protein
MSACFVRRSPALHCGRREGTVPLDSTFKRALRLTRFDVPLKYYGVITGFRCGHGSYQALVGVTRSDGAWSRL